MNDADEIVRYVGRHLAALRAMDGRSQRALAEAMGTVQAQIVRVENGRGQHLQLRTVYAYADALGYDVEVRFTRR